MKISRTSPRTGQINTMEIAVTEQQIAAWINGALIQTVMPDLTLEEREFIMTGYTPEDWAELFGEEA
jgi:hypothetical protein